MTNTTAVRTETESLTAVVERARQLYTALIAGLTSAPSWWTAVVVTASSARQAVRYRAEIDRRLAGGRIPEQARYLVIPDPQGVRLGSGGATLHALRETTTACQPGTLGDWWQGQRVLLIHSGGDSRRLPQYSLTGKLFSAVPLETPWGEASTVFDEMLALSSLWVNRIRAGLVAASGDVMLTFNAEGIDWSRPGVVGLGLLQPADVATRHGVYIADEQGRVYAFLQKPSVAEMQASGAIRADGLTPVDSGLLHFDPQIAARLTELARKQEFATEVDLYRHFTMALTGQWKPELSDGPLLQAIASGLKGVPFWCSVVEGDFTHIGTTSLFRRLMTEDTEFSRLQSAQRRLGATRQAGVRSAGVVTDSVLAGGADLKPGTVVIECHLQGPVRAAPGAVLHGLEGIAGPVDIPEDTVVHQLPVWLPDGRRGIVIRIYGVVDDPKAAGERATWFGRPLAEELSALGMDPEAVWPGLDAPQRTLWNARLFPVGTVEEAWATAQWMMRLNTQYSAADWESAQRLSLATSAEWADGAALESARARRLRAYWRTTALSLVDSGADVRPLLANAPGTGALAETGEMLCRKALAAETAAPTDAASLYYIGGLFLGQAGLAKEADDSRQAAFRMVQVAVEAGTRSRPRMEQRPWRYPEVTVEGPARIDLAGGWSDTPPFCLDWGGTVLNAAVLLNGQYPIQAKARRLFEPVVRIAGAEYRRCEEILAPSTPGDPTSIARTALRMTGLFRAGEPLERILEPLGGGVEISSEVNLPMGSGLGTSSILAACIVRGLAEMADEAVDPQELSERVIRLEQLMTTGGGWQDQAGGIFPGAKLVLSGPGLRQRLRVQPVVWSEERRKEFEGVLVLYYTGIRRVARDLLRQVVGRYLARETACVQVLHSIKTLALEMSHAMQEGDWPHLGELMNRHWVLNQVLDPNTTNAPINAVLEAVRPYIYGAKLAGAGGGGFMILLARTEEAAGELRRVLAGMPGGAVYGFGLAAEGLRTTFIGL
jgi:fucokinase